VVQSKAGIERQLHIVRSGQVPQLGRDVAGFVVDDQQSAVAQPVDAVQAQVEIEPCNVNGALGLGLGTSNATRAPRNPATR
jgi:hypothetical protein